MATNKKALCALMERPTEALLFPKGLKKPIEYDLPNQYLSKRHRKLKDKIRQRVKVPGAVHVEIKDVGIPDISIPLEIPRRGNFSLFIPKHRKIAAKLIDLFMCQANVADLLSVAAYCRDRLNPYLFHYALSVAITHRKDTKDIVLPNFVSTFPGKFIDSSIFPMIRAEASLFPEDGRQPVIIPREFTARAREPEQAVAYFREDIGVNLHHWHWHLVYPLLAEDRSIVDKDRRGELFYYMHSQILARYDTERACSGLPFTIPIESLRELIPEGYFPKLTQLNSSRGWASRFRNIYLSNVDVPEQQAFYVIPIVDQWKATIIDAINDGYVIGKDNQRITFTESTGIDMLGNMVEASMLTPNDTLYGDYHNAGHFIVAFCHDPDGKFLEVSGVMADTATAMRDPVFYRWHTNINELFNLYKNTLPNYSRAQLDFPSVTISDFKVSVPGKLDNELYTFWEQSDIDLSRGIDFLPRSPLLVRFTHLQHEPITYSLKIKNVSVRQKRGTVRLFMAPQADYQGTTLSFDELRIKMIELDKFSVVLRPGDNAVVRTSEESSVTIPYEMTFRNLDAYDKTDPEATKSFNFCGCGWPDHMLIPKGTLEGFNVYLFAMVSDYVVDSVVQSPSDGCTGAESYCGLSNSKYPDKRAMGYPFDRKAKDGVLSLNDFLTPNMIATQGKIFHVNETRVREPGTEVGVAPV